MLLYFASCLLLRHLARDHHGDLFRSRICRRAHFQEDRCGGRMHRINYLWLLFVFVTVYLRIETCLADNGKHVTYANSSLSDSTLFCFGF